MLLRPKKETRRRPAARPATDREPAAPAAAGLRHWHRALGHEGVRLQQCQCQCQRRCRCQCQCVAALLCWSGAARRGAVRCGAVRCSASRLLALALAVSGSGCLWLRLAWAAGCLAASRSPPRAHHHLIAAPPPHLASSSSSSSNSDSNPQTGPGQPADGRARASPTSRQLDATAGRAGSGRPGLAGRPHHMPCGLARCKGARPSPQPAKIASRRATWWSNAATLGPWRRPTWTQRRPCRRLLP